jgi:leucyl aminopeptidase (aminopeptidase T)
MKHNMTIEEMIAAGMPWDQIKARINELQREQKEKEAAEAAAKMRQVNKAQEVKAARERFINAFLDWVIVEGVIPSEDREAFGEMVEETCDGLMAEMKQVMIIEAMLKGLK